MPTYTGTSAAETITGSSGDDVINGMGGADTLNGLDGADVFTYDPGHGVASDGGGDGADVIDGGDGVDRFQVNSGYLTQQVGRSTFWDYQTYTFGAVGGSAVFGVRQFDGFNGTTGTVVNVSMMNVETASFIFTDTPAPPREIIGFIVRNFSTNDVLTIGSLAGTSLTGRIDFHGGAGNDILDAGAVTNQIVASGDEGDDVLISGSGDDTLTGGDGNDTLTSGAGSDTMTGGVGDDTYVLVSATDTLVELAGGGVDTVTTSLTSYALRTNFERLIYVGAANFTGIGNTVDNFIQGGTGSDYLIGLDGNDTLVGGTGLANSLQGGTGNDVYVVSVAGDSIIEFAGEGTDRVETTLTSYTLRANVEDLTYTGSAAFTGTGNSADNRLQGGSGADRLIGLGGNNSYFGGAGVDTVDYSAAGVGVVVDMNQGTAANNGYGGTDSFNSIENLTGSAFNDILIGQGSNNFLFGGRGADYLIGLDGDDVMDGGADAPNTLQGGTGNDTYVVSNAGDSLVEFAGQGVDTVQTGLAAFTLAANIENLFHSTNVDFVGRGNAEANLIRGAAGIDTLYGMDGNDILHGFDGDDVLDGGAGADQLYGEAGADRMTGGLGDDTFYATSADTLIEGAGGGTDRIISFSADITMADNIEELYFDASTSSSHVGVGNAIANLMVGNGGEDNFSGLGGNDVLRGEYGDDILSGGDGDDILTGAEGFDILTGGAGADRFVFSQLDLLAPKDEVRDFHHAEGDRIDLSFLSFYMRPGQNAFADGYVQIQPFSYGGQVTTRILIDLDGSGAHQYPAHEIAVVFGDPLTQSDFFFG